MESYLNGYLQNLKLKLHQKEKTLNGSYCNFTVSADFLASDFITENELPPLLNNAEKKGTKILPVILKASRFEREECLCQFQALNPPNNPISNMNEHEQEEL